MLACQSGARLGLRTIRRGKRWSLSPPAVWAAARRHKRYGTTGKLSTLANLNDATNASRSTHAVLLRFLEVSKETDAPRLYLFAPSILPLQASWPSLRPYCHHAILPRDLTGTATPTGPFRHIGKASNSDCMSVSETEILGHNLRTQDRRGPCTMPRVL